MERGWEPDIKKFLRKVIISLSLGLLWLTAGVTGGIYYELGFIGTGPAVITILFYCVMLFSLFFILRYLYNSWKKE